MGILKYKVLKQAAPGSRHPVVHGTSCGIASAVYTISCFSNLLALQASLKDKSLPPLNVNLHLGALRDRRAADRCSGGVVATDRLDLIISGRPAGGGACVLEAFHQDNFTGRACAVLK